MRAVRTIGLFVLVVIASVGCSTREAAPRDTTPTASVATEPGAEPIYRAKCGSCHTPVEPGSHSKTELETAFRRHRRRLALSESQWSALVDYLASH